MTPSEIEVMVASWSRGSAILVDQRGHQSERPALFVYPLHGGFAWVEPSYLDPWGAASPAVHVADGPARDATEEAGEPAVAGGSSAWTAMAVHSEPGMLPDIDRALAWAFSELERRGTTWAAERERVRDLLAAD